MSHFIDCERHDPLTDEQEELWKKIISCKTIVEEINGIRMDPWDYQLIECSFCKSYIETLFYSHCMTCRNIKCLRCAETICVKHGHESVTRRLMPDITESHFDCNYCGDVLFGYGYGSDELDYDLCMNCYHKSQNEIIKQELKLMQLGEVRNLPCDTCEFGSIFDWVPAYDVEGFPDCIVFCNQKENLNHGKYAFLVEDNEFVSYHVITETEDIKDIIDELESLEESEDSPIKHIVQKRGWRTNFTPRYYNEQ